MEIFKAQLEALAARFANLGMGAKEMGDVMHACADTIVRNNAADQGHSYNLGDAFNNPSGGQAPSDDPPADDPE